MRSDLRAAAFAWLCLAATAAPRPAAATPDGRWLELGPPFRSEHLAVYDPAGDRMLVIGGHNGANYRDEIWSLGFSPAPSWSQIDVQGTPYGRAGVAGVFDPVRNQVILFGGALGSTLTNDVWVLDLTGTPAWSQLSPAGTPPAPRNYHTAIYDSVRDRLIVFGGGKQYVIANDVWALSLSGTPTWTQLSASGTPPAARHSHAAIYDAAGDRMVVFGGTDGSAYLDDTWALSLADPPTWSLLSPAGTPPALSAAHSAIYDAPRGRMIVCAAQDPGYPEWNQGVWELSLGDSPAWTERTPAGPGPTTRYRHSAILDPSRDRMVVYGGSDNSTFSDSWALSLDGTPAWTPVIVPVVPPDRSHHAAILDSDLHRMVVFGGFQVTGAALKDIWTLTMGTVPLWTELHAQDALAYGPGDTILARGDPACIYDPVRNRLVLFGGWNNGIGAYGDTWLLSLDSTPTWTHVIPPGGSPSHRKGAAAAYDPVGDRMIMFGGQSATGAVLNDTWALTLGANPTWVRLFPATFNPSARVYSKMVYDASENRMLLFGGYRPNGTPSPYLNDTWTLSLGDPPDWYPLSSGSPPAGRHQFGLCYDGSRDRLLLLDGQGMGSSLGFDDAYARALDGSSGWAPLVPLGESPGPRRNHSALYDPDLDRVVVYGGAPSIPLTDIWFLSFRDEPAPEAASLTGATVQSGDVHLQWQGREPYRPDAHVYRKPAGEGWSQIGTVSPDGSNALAFVDTHPPNKASCRYVLGFPAELGERYAGQADVPLSTTGVPEVAAGLALHSVRMAGRAVDVSFSLADPTPARLDLLDLAGRRVASSDVTSLGPGEHHATLAAKGTPAPGVYWVRLSQGRSSRVLKAALLR